MLRIVVEVQIGGGSFAEGFTIWSKIAIDDHSMDSRDDLSHDDVRRTTRPLTELEARYLNWHREYTDIARISDSRTFLYDIPDGVTSYSFDALMQADSSLRSYLERELFRSLSLTYLERWITRVLLRHQISLEIPLPVIFHIETGNNQQNLILKKLPWHLWSLFNDGNLSNAEVALYGN